MGRNERPCGLKVDEGMRSGTGVGKVTGVIVQIGGFFDDENAFQSGQIIKRGGIRSLAGHLEGQPYREGRALSCLT